MATSGLRAVPRSVRQHFLDTFFYAPEVFLLDDAIRASSETREIEARLDTNRNLPIAAWQRGDEAAHPRHVSAPELPMATGNLGCLSAYLFHGVRWDEGWVGFGSRLHRADFRGLARLGPPLELRSRETRVRVGERRIVLRFEFVFQQEDRVVYRGDQTAMFLLRAVVPPAGQRRQRRERTAR